MTLDDLRAQLEAMPVGTLVPAQWVAEQLAALAPVAPADEAVLDVAALARRWHRSASAVRELLEGGQVAGAWKHGGKAWRVPREGVEAYEAAQAQPPRPRSPRRGTPNLRAIARGDSAA